MPRRRRRFMKLYNQLERSRLRKLLFQNPECELPVGCTYDDAFRILEDHAERKAVEAKAAEDARVQTMWWNND